MVTIWCKARYEIRNIAMYKKFSGVSTENRGNMNTRITARNDKRARVLAIFG